MKIIDKKGKLFGLINIIDLFVIAAVIVVASALVLRFTGARDLRHEIGSSPVTLKVVISDVRQETVDVIQVGDVVRDGASGQVFGTIVDKFWENQRRIITTEDDRIVWAEIPERYSIELTLDCRGHDLGHVLRIASYEIRVGTSVSFYARNYSVTGTVLAYEIGE